MLEIIEEMEESDFLSTSRMIPTRRREEKKKLIREWTSSIGITWGNIEDILLWKKPVVSATLYIFITGLFWRFISGKLQAIGFLLTAVLLPCCFEDTRQQMWTYCTQRFQMQLNPEKKSLGVDSNDIENIIVDCLLHVDRYYEYLMTLSQPSLRLLVSSYIVVLVAAYAYLPWAGLVYLVVTAAYFYPVLVYMDVGDVIARHCRKLREPFLEQWKHSRTKRRRDRTRGRVSSQEETDSEADYEEFIESLSSKECERILEEETCRHSSSSDNDEFQLGEDLIFEHSSDDDDSSCSF